MRSLRDYPIKHKLVGIIMLTSVVAVLLACLVFIANEQVTYRQTMIRDFAILADVIQDNVAPGLAFNDATAMEKTLQSMKAQPHILAGAVYDKAGKRVASYERSKQPGGFPWPTDAGETSHFHSGRLDSFRRITLAGEVIGTVFIASDLGDLKERQVRFALTGGLVLLLSGVVAYLIAARLQRVISVPLFDLSLIASRVTTEKNFALRAVKHGEDELGSLIDQFNDMLAQIERQELSLREANEQLEQRVEARTRELQQEVAERKRAELSLKESEAELKEAQRIAGLGSWHHEINSGAVRWSEDTFRIFGRDSSLGAPSYSEFSKILTPESLVELKAAICRTIEQDVPYEIELEAIRPDQSRRWMLSRGEPIRDPTGTISALRGTVLDITMRKRAEIELKEAQQRLIQTSRQAGMAEVATSVLHNVGNVLNSVSVSAEVVAGKVRQSRAGGLKAVAVLLREHAHDLPAFLAHDPRGKELPDYLLKLIEHLAEPQPGILQELETLRKNIEHIKEIVATQQRHARGSGVMETLAVAELVEEALSINAGGFGRHEVQLVKEFSPVPPVVTDRHKVLQILVNLVNNAKHALAKVAGEKRLVVRVTSNEPEAVRIAVIDNGIGIAPENLARIFQHGFTTKKDGHGFGLHSGALAAKELGGRLTVHSDGLGRGAVFTLELPLQNHKA